MNRKRPEDLRSHRWLGVNDLRSFGHRSRLRQFGYDAADWAGRPVIGIINTWSDINACHAHLRARAEDVISFLRDNWRVPGVYQLPEKREGVKVDPKDVLLPREGRFPVLPPARPLAAAHATIDSVR